MVDDDGAELGRVRITDVQVVPFAGGDRRVRPRRGGGLRRARRLGGVAPGVLGGHRRAGARRHAGRVPRVRPALEVLDQLVQLPVRRAEVRVALGAAEADLADRDAAGGQLGHRGGARRRPGTRRSARPGRAPPSPAPRAASRRAARRRRRPRRGAGTRPSTSRANAVHGRRQGRPRADEADPAHAHGARLASAGGPARAHRDVVGPAHAVDRDRCAPGSTAPTPSSSTSRCTRTTWPRTGLDHPGRDEVLASQPTDWRTVVRELTQAPVAARRSATRST